MLRLLAIPAVLIALLAAALAWSGEGNRGRADFAYVSRDHVTLDLNNMSWGVDIRLANALWEGLYTLDPQTRTAQLSTADHVAVSADRKVYTFHIRTEAKWSDGHPVTADDFLFEWRRMLESPKEYTYLHHYIKGAEAYELAFADYAKAPNDRKPPKPDFATVGERVNPDGTLRLELVNPVPFLPALLAFAPFFPMDAASMAEFRQVDPGTGAVSYKPEFTRPPKLVTNGPYRLAAWEFKRRVRLVANPHYWDHAHVRSQTIDEFQADNALAAYRLFQQGDVDWLSDVDPDVAAPTLARHRPELHTFPAFGTSFYEMNCLPKLPGGRPNPLVDVRVRQALAMAIDKRQIVANVGRLNQPTATDFVPPGVFPGYQSPPGLPFDVARARRLLADAGYPGGHGFPRLSILYNNEGSLGSDVATIVRRQWADNLGISIDPNGLEKQQYAHLLNSQGYDIANASWTGDYFDPSTFTDKYLSNAENNAAKWADAGYDAACGRAAAEPDPAKRLADFAEAEDRLVTQVPIIPLYHYVGTFMYRSNVVGITPNPQSVVMFKSVGVDHARPTEPGGSAAGPAVSTGGNEGVH